MTAEQRQARQDYALQAIGCLRSARNLRTTRASWVQEAYAQHGERGPLMSGIEQAHFPEDVKDLLRTNAREISKDLEWYRAKYQRREGAE
jgi:hypothetical protein